MCILIHNTPKSRLTKEHWADMLRRNQDGFGAMYSDGKRVHVIKTLDGSPEELDFIYRKYLRGREAVIHLRMQTHGAINMDNCHPYKVTDDLYMAHNGVLSTGNWDDPSKSDTWHLIEFYLKPILEKSPDVLFEPSFQKMLAGFIGYSNKLAFVHKTRGVVVINRSAGIKHRETWFSNTYAWSPEKFGYERPPARTYTYTSGGKTTTVIGKPAVKAPAGVGKDMKSAGVIKSAKDSARTFLSVPKAANGTGLKELPPFSTEGGASANAKPAEQSAKPMGTALSLVEGTGGLRAEPYGAEKVTNELHRRNLVVHGD